MRYLPAVASLALLTGAARGLDLELGAATLRTIEEDGRVAGVEIALGDLLAQVAPLSRIGWVDEDGDEHWAAISPAPTSVTSSRDGMEISAAMPDGEGRNWECNFRFEPLADNAGVFITYTAVPDHDVTLLRFEGPFMRLPGAEVDEALFPGLEYLDGERPSSSRETMRCIEHDRTMPHPYKVTMPLMAVSRGGRTLMLSWDPLRPYDWDRWSPAPVFSSPNRLQGRNEHLMGLFAPSYPYAVDPSIPNQDVETYTARAGVPLSIQCELRAVEGRCDAAVLRWLELAGGPPPPPPEPRNRQENLALCADALLQTAWSETREGWWPHATYTDYEMRKQTSAGPMPQYCTYLWALGHLIDDPELSKACRERFERVAGKFAGGTADASFGFRFGPVEATLVGMRKTARSLAQSQKPDGSWRFEPNPWADINRIKVRELGPRGGVEVGTIATQARQISQYALMTGDAQALTALRKALRRMSDFRVPRGASLWEVPLRAPELIASKHATAAFLDAYRLTGEGKYLENARYWATTAIPFHYMWAAPDRPVMKYGSVPVFGTSIYIVSWIGIIVQWEAVTTALEYRDLAAFDDTLDWEAFADGFTICCQQQLFEEEEHRGLYPDAYNVTYLEEPSPIGTNLTPVLIIDNMLGQAGQPTRPWTETLRTEDGNSVLATSGARITDMRMEGGRLEARFGEYPEGEGFRTVIAGLGRPASVSYAGAPLPTYGADTFLGPPGWRYMDRDGLTVITGRFERSARLAVDCGDSPSYTLPPFSAEEDELHVELRIDEPAEYGGDEVWFSARVTDRDGQLAEHPMLEGRAEPGGLARQMAAADEDGWAPFKARVPAFVGDDVCFLSVKAEALGTLSGEAVTETRVASAIADEPGSVDLTEVIPGQTATVSVPVENRSASRITGELWLSGTGGIAERGGTATFALGPGETADVEVEVPIPQRARPGNNLLRAYWIVDGHNLPTRESRLDVPFRAMRATRTPVIDGKLDEWHGTVEYHYTEPLLTIDEFAPGPQIPGGSATIQMMWDADNLYLGFTVRDEMHVQEHADTDIFYGDSVQVGFDMDRDAGFKPRYDEDDREFGFALGAAGDAVAWQWWPSENAGPAKDATAAVVLGAEDTYYEIALPWVLLGMDKGEAGRAFSIGLLVNDNDGRERRRMEITGGIPFKKDPKLFPPCVLLDETPPRD